MRARYVALVVVVLPSLAAAQSLCNPCVDPSVGWPRLYDNAGTASMTKSVTADDLLRLGLVTAADMLAQVPSNLPFADQRNLVADRSLFRLRAERLAARSEPAPPLVHETTLAAPVESVWHAWTTNAGLSAWLAPRADINLRIGGKLRVAYDAAGVFGDTAVENEILAYDPQRMLAFRVTQAPADFPHAAAADTWTVVYLDAVNADSTRVRVVVNGLSSNPAAQDVRAFFESSNAETLRRLEERFGTPQ